MVEINPIKAENSRRKKRLMTITARTTQSTALREPVFSKPGVRVYEGDAMKVLQELPAESVDMIFSDPPYGLSNGGMSVHAGRRVSVNKGAWDKSRGVEADFAFHQEWISACVWVCNQTEPFWVSGTYHSIYACGFALQLGGWHVWNEICWYKPNAPPHLACRMFAASHETLIWARKTKAAKHVFHYQEMKRESSGWDFVKKANRQMRSVWGGSLEDEVPVSAWAMNTPNPKERFTASTQRKSPSNYLNA